MCALKKCHVVGLGLLVALGVAGARSARAAEVVRLGEVIIVQGDDQSLDINGSALGVRALEVITRQVIETFGDVFHAITIWTTFNDRANNAGAYARSVKNEVRGIGAPIRDESRQYGSPGGVLRSVLNMKTIGMNTRDTREAWASALPTWGQEGGHRWMAFMKFRDARTGKDSDALLGRDCAHYAKFVDTQASVHDGYAWQDNGDGSFTWTERAQRYSYLDLYGMGLLAPDEMPPLFFIDNIPGMRAPATCREHTNSVPPRTVMGTRVEVAIDDIVAANGERLPAAHDEATPQDYWREAEVVVTRPDETVDSPNPLALADKLNRARGYWEDWVRVATRNRLIMCTQVSGDCGDARSDVKRVAFNAARLTPGKGPLTFDLDVANSGARAATGVKASLDVTVAGQTQTLVSDLGTLAPGKTVTAKIQVDMKQIPCGTEASVKAYTQSDFHYHRARASFLVGAEPAWEDGFETDRGWAVDPDGDDGAAGAVWERGAPERSELLKRQVQPAGAHSGNNAWATGLLASPRDRASFVTAGRSTLASPAFDARALRDPTLRYWVAFAGVRGDGSDSIEPSPDAHFSVLVRSVAVGGAPSVKWQQVDHLTMEFGKGWQQRTAPLPRDLNLNGGIQLRFVASDESAAGGAVEAALDDVQVMSNLPGCSDSLAMSDDAAGCACDVGAHRSLGSAVRQGWGWTALAAALVIRRRRRPRR